MRPNRSPGNGSGVLPLFPLPNCVLFPSVPTLLHIFEPRYREMTANVLAAERAFILVLLQPGWEADYEGTPPIHSVGCIAHIVADTRLPDGRYNLLVVGGPRVQILEEAPSTPYRRVRFEVIPEPEEGLSWQAPSARSLSLHFDALLCRAPATLSSLSIHADETPGRLCDKILASLQIDAQQKQALLAQLDVEQRLETTSEILRRLVPPRSGHQT